MKKILLLAALLLAVMQVTASNVDLATAQGAAQRFLMNKAAKGRFMTSAPAVKWTHQAKNSTNAALTAYYVVNTEAGYAIVAGDSRAREILAYGEGQIQSMNDLPDAVQYFLDIYQKQMEYLQAHPGLMVQKTANRGGISVEPLLTTAWAQDKPYNMKTPKKGYGSNPYCKVGCSAVSLAQVMNYWKYPEKSPALPGYTTETHGYVMDPLPEYTFQWDRMRDTYPTSESGLDQMSQEDIDAISWLMLYTGYAMNMDYATDQSGAEYDEIDQAIRTFGFTGYSMEMKWDYDDGTVNYTEEQWAELIQSELVAGRPLVYCAFDMQSDSAAIAGHAFNVDGYNAENDTYHVNFGMSADKNGYFALDAFTVDNGMTVYNFYPLLFAGLQKPTGPAAPRMIVSPSTLNMECYAGKNTTATFTVAGLDLTGDITLTVNDANNVFTTDVATIALADASSKTITVTYAPEAVGTHEATITLSSAGAEDVTVTLKGTATKAPVVKYDPVMQPATDINLNSFRAVWTDQTAEGVASYTLDVKEKQAGAPELLAEVDWSNAVGDGDDDLPEGWTRGDYSIFFDEGGMAITSDSYIKTNTLDIGTDKVTVVFKAKNYYSHSVSTLTVKTSKDQKQFDLTQQFDEYTVVLDCNESDQIEFFANANYPTIQSIQIYAGELQAPALRANVTGDASHYVITGITDKYYDVKNLNNEGTYVYKVKAIYTDGTESKWSNAETVTLQAGGQTYAQGDVNMDGSVNISDVTDLIDMLLSDNTKPSGDVNGDGSINITDVTDLIDLLLKN